jgi:DNA-binding transcriptional ArsR family regulator
MKDHLDPTRQDETAARIAQALGHPIRVAILRALADGEVCSCELAPRFALDQSGISRHLTALRRAGLIVSRRDGVRRLHRLVSRDVLQLVDLAQTLGDAFKAH